MIAYLGNQSFINSNFPTQNATYFALQSSYNPPSPLRLPTHILNKLFYKWLTQQRRTQGPRIIVIRPLTRSYNSNHTNFVYSIQWPFEKNLTFVCLPDRNTLQSSSIIIIYNVLVSIIHIHTQTYPSWLADKILLPLQLPNLNDHPLRQ